MAPDPAQRTTALAGRPPGTAGQASHDTPAATTVGSLEGHASERAPAGNRYGQGCRAEGDAQPSAADAQERIPSSAADAAAGGPACASPHADRDELAALLGRIAALPEDQRQALLVALRKLQ